MTSHRDIFLRRLISHGLAGVILFWGALANAQGLVRDAEIERTLGRIVEPLLRVAGYGPGNIEVLVVQDSSLNAFVINGHNIFVHSGLITKLNSIPKLQSVLAHELAHISSGHLTRRAINRQNAASATGLGLLLSLAVAATGNHDAAGGVAIGAAGAAQRSFLSHTRAQESTADRIGAGYMVRAGVDPAAAIAVLEIFRGQEVLKASRQDPYVRTHPLSRERIRALQGQVAAYQGKFKNPSQELQYWHDRMIVKFNGFLGNPRRMLRRIKKGDNSEIALYGRAIAYHRLPDLKKSLAAMNALLRKRPNDPYYNELKGQILLENGNAKAAIPFYQRAVALAPREPLILAGLGRALLALKTKSGDRQALDILKKSRRMDPRNARMLRDLALAYAKAGKNGQASLVTAERYALLTRFSDAQTHATRAAGLLPRGSAGWLKAQDIIAAAKVAQRN